ncbi:WbqC family protein [Paraburkholderia sp. BL10I2N1]|uniref:WbqC family protein n=1 Tax=Paraburkholderia sp. BL10I2N1 TaxID=1938796 RepID=UPI0010E22101|nr:WbqC family protein [Paraburkholderia sp. BL10I2N1]TDN68006.1 WbqC-like protein [Paraburkholderia sp. BL10I2N1]
MKLGIMQPYFFPYLGHFALIAAVDEWIVFDVTQYTPKTWMNRNRILHPKEGWQYATVPLANSSTSIKTHEARVLNLIDTKTSLLGKLSTFRKHAPFYAEVSQLVRDAFERTTGDSLCALNVNALQAVCEYLGLPFSWRIGSELNLAFPEEMGPGDWAPFICRALGATEYVNPLGGRDLFDPVKFARIGVSLRFAGFDEFTYDPAPFRYEPHLSIIDVLLWNAPDKVAHALRSHVTLQAP